MATRFYLIGGTIVSTPATVRGGWEITSSTRTIPLSTVKSGQSITIKNNPETSSPVPNDVLMLRAVSGTLAAQTISGTLNLTLGVKAPYLLSRYYWHIHAYVTQGDTELVRGTLLNDYREDVSNHWPDTAQTRTLSLNAALTSVAIQAGDKIVVEIGYISRSAINLIAGGNTQSTVAGPASSVQVNFFSSVSVGEGIFVMVAGRKASGPMNFGTCTDNFGNTYEIAVPQQRITSNPEFAIIIYYCAKVIISGSPFTVTVTGDGSDHNFQAYGVKVQGLKGGLLALNNISSASSSVANTVPDTGGAGDLAGPLTAATICARVLSAGSLNVHVDNMTWALVGEQLITNTNQQICSEADVCNVIDSTNVPLRATWVADVVSHWAAGMAAFKRTGEVLGTGDIYYGAPEGSTDLTHPDTDVNTQAGFIEFSQNLLLAGELSDIGHIVTQVSRVLPLPPAELSHAVTQVATFAPPKQQISHAVVQVAHPHPGAPAHLSHLITQVTEAPGIANAAISHAIIQVAPVIIQALPELSGIYFLNPSKQANHDSYYRNTELKIPDPTIKTAYLGE